MKKLFVVSAVNFSEGGPLTVLRKFLEAASEELSDEWEILALVHNPNLIDIKRVITLGFPEAKSSWFRRLFLEWVSFMRLSRKRPVDIWMSLHDITPRVNARHRFVYCHNPAPFHSLTLRDAFLEPKLALFHWFYGALYRIGIGRNTAVIVQQAWLRDQFQRRYKPNQVVVAHPAGESARALSMKDEAPPQRAVFLYPALPRAFKNFETLCQAVEIMPTELRSQFEVRLTIDGTENSYAKWLFKKYGWISEIKWLGLQSSTQMMKHYSECTCVVFPSRLETWGLPISEAQEYRKPLLVAEMPYARESAGSYDGAFFFPVTNAAELQILMAAHMSGHLHFTQFSPSVPAEPFCEGWQDLIKKILSLSQ